MHRRTSFDRNPPPGSLGAYRERREVARSMAEIAPDPPGWLTALRFDIDSEGGGAAWIEADLPAPNLVVVNPRNGHAHLIYLLGAWVQTTSGIRAVSR